MSSLSAAYRERNFPLERWDLYLFSFHVLTPLRECDLFFSGFQEYTRFHGWDSRDEQYPSVRSPVFYQDNVILTTACSTSSIEKHKELPKQQQ
ncbi:hypothetical protein CKAN_00785300 [Cinnamomum micranthum f. kanehirae]|uniref:Uncharacterized protein n=1 Tax=Cinnamomum micranthum f. kanehirae TaxID=337451 RepID=A0A3S4NMW0_9MAGN|nr:hypothetical protein CKAN_00785300 [Cinnamomum micranthum f. kanehirae]